MKRLVTLLIALIISSVVGCSMGPKENAGNNPLNPSASVGTLAEPLLNTDYDTNGLLFVFSEPVNIDLGTVVLVSSNIRPIFHNGVELYPTVQFIWMSNNTTLYIKDSSLNIAGIQEVELRNFWNKDKSKKLDYCCENIFRPEFTGYIETVYDVQSKKLKITFPQEIKSKADDVVIFVGGQVIENSAKSITADTRSILVNIDLDDYPTIVVDKVKFYDGSILSDKVVHMRNILPPYIVPTISGFIGSLCTNRMFSVNEVNLSDPATIQKYRHFDFSSLLKRVRSFKIIVNGYVIAEWNSGIDFNGVKKPFVLDLKNFWTNEAYGNGKVHTYNVRFCAVGFNGQAYETNFTFAVDATVKCTNAVNVYEPIYVKSGNTFSLTSWTKAVGTGGEYNPYIPQCDFLKYEAIVGSYGDEYEYRLKVKERVDVSQVICDKLIPFLSIDPVLGIVNYKLTTEIAMMNSGQKLNFINNKTLNYDPYSGNTSIVYPQIKEYIPSLTDSSVYANYQGGKAFTYNGKSYAVPGYSTLFYYTDKFYPVLAKSIKSGTKSVSYSVKNAASSVTAYQKQDVQNDYHTYTATEDGKMVIGLLASKSIASKGSFPSEAVITLKKSYNSMMNDGSYTNKGTLYNIDKILQSIQPEASMAINDEKDTTFFSYMHYDVYMALYFNKYSDPTVDPYSPSLTSYESGYTVNIGNMYDYSITLARTFESYQYYGKSTLYNVLLVIMPIMYQWGDTHNGSYFSSPTMYEYNFPNFSISGWGSKSRIGAFDYTIQPNKVVSQYLGNNQVKTFIIYNYYITANEPVKTQLGLSGTLKTSGIKTNSFIWNYLDMFNNSAYRVNGSYGEGYYWTSF
jgi:hypothetical protein